jgi:hypothetical protein
MALCYSGFVPLTAKGSTILRAMEREYPSTKKAKSVFYASRNAHKISGVDAKDHQPLTQGRLTYYATQLPDKATWFQTPEGYRIYKNVPLARTGAQQYLGHEIKKNPGYKAEWNIGENDLVTVYRPEEEVLAPESLASFEGKSILDEHPPSPQILIDALDEYEAMSKGHVQNIRAGERLPSGEIGMVGDLFVKHPDLNVKVEDGVRDVSCGYTFILDKDEGGRFVQRKIRGNHVAIVPAGRAGSDVGIKDAHPKLSKGRMKMSNRLLVALGLQAALKDASPEDAAGIVDAALKEEKGAKDEEESKAKAEAKREAEEREKKAEKDKQRKAARDAAAHPEKCMCDDCMDKRSSKDADPAEFGHDEMTDADKLEEEEKKDKAEEKKEAEAKDKKAGKDEEAAVLPADEHSKSEFSTGDAAKHLLTLKPIIAKHGDRAAKDALNSLCKGIRQVKAGANDSAADPFALLTRITSVDGANDQEPEIPMFQFFNGKSHADGLKAWNDYQTARAARARR